MGQEWVNHLAWLDGSGDCSQDVIQGASESLTETGDLLLPYCLIVIKDSLLK